MSVLPVIVRELRSQARQPLTYWLRLVGGISVVLAIGMALWTMGAITGQARGSYGFQNTVQAFGTALFGKMNLFIFLAIWLFVPLATADAVSRERREGTLPLLYNGASFVGDRGGQNIRAHVARGFAFPVHGSLAAVAFGIWGSECE